MAEWDIETITLRAARDYADQYHFARGAGDDAAAYEEDLGRAKAEIATALAEHDREVRLAALIEARDAATRPYPGLGWEASVAKIEALIEGREPDDVAPGGES